MQRFHFWNTTLFFLLSIVFLVAAGSALRFFHLGSAPYWMDEGYTINAVRSIEEKGVSVLDSGKAYHCPLYCVPTSWIASSFGESEESYRALAATSGVALILLFIFFTYYFFGRFSTSFGGKFPALLVGILSTFSYWQIAWSRQARWYTLFTFFFWLALFFFSRLLYDRTNEKSSKRKVWMLLGTLVFTALSILTHGLGYLLPFLFLWWYVIEALRRKKVSLRFLSLLVLSLGALIILGEYLLDLHLFSRLLHLVHLSNNSLLYGGFMVRNYFLFIPLALFSLVSRGRSSIRFFLASIFLAYFLSLSFLTTTIEYRYLFHVTPVLFILAALGLSDIVRAVKKTWLHVSIVLVYIALFFIIGKGVLTAREMYFLESDNPETHPEQGYYAYTPQPNWNGAYTFIKEVRTPEDIVISSMPQFNKIFLNTPGYWIKYDYLRRGDGSAYVVKGKDFYVGATVVDSTEALASLAKTQHGYIVFDFMATDGRIPKSTLDFIANNMELVYYEKTNAYSVVWVAKF